MSPDSPRAAFVDHLTIRVRELEASRRFYAAALAPWGSRETEGDWGVSFGPPGSEDVAIAEGEPSGPIHLALNAPDRETVERFYEAALSGGGRDNGPCRGRWPLPLGGVRHRQGQSEHTRRRCDDRGRLLHCGAASAGSELAHGSAGAARLRALGRGLRPAVRQRGQSFLSTECSVGLWLVSGWG